MNNLDPCVAQFPEELVTYGGNGQVLSNWAQVKTINQPDDITMTTIPAETMEQVSVFALSVLVGHAVLIRDD